MDCLITNGKQYIRLDSNGSPQTCGQVLAERFSEDKAKNIIKNLPKPLRKFHFNVQLVSEIAAQPKPIEEEKLPEDINGILAELDDYYEDYQRNPKYDNPYTYHGETALEKELSMNDIGIGNFFKMVIDCISDREKYIENAEYVDKILKMDFFNVDCDKSSYSNTNIKNGSLRRIIIEAIMTSKYLSHFDKDFGKMCAYLTENANESIFIDFYLTLEKLSNVLRGDTSDIFNNKNSFLWFALFDKFLEYNIEDDKFNGFIQEFKETLHNKEIDGITYDCLNGQKGTKDRSSVTKRFNHLFTLMKEYLHIEDSVEEITEEHEPETVEDDLFDTETVEESPEKPAIAEVTEYSAIGNTEIEHVSGEVIDNTIHTDMKSALKFVQDCVDEAVSELDVQDYEEYLDTITLDVDNSSKLLDAANHDSIIGVIAYAYQNDVDCDDWFKDYFNRNNTYDVDQKKNYLNMRNDLIAFNKKAVI